MYGMCMHMRDNADEDLARQLVAIKHGSRWDTSPQCV